MTFALDTNVLVYAEGFGEPEKCRILLTLAATLPVSDVVIPVQALGELYNVLTRKRRVSPDAAKAPIVAWKDSFPTAEPRDADLLAAVDISARHGLQIWDSIILAVASRHGSRLMLTEDMQAGCSWGGVTLANPLDATPHPLPRAYLDHPD
jgi:predicted nucleic acid-binding protein